MRNSRDMMRCLLREDPIRESNGARWESVQEAIRLSLPSGKNAWEMSWEEVEQILFDPNIDVESDQVRLLMAQLYPDVIWGGEPGKFNDSTGAEEIYHGEEDAGTWKEEITDPSGLEVIRDSVRERYERIYSAVVLEDYDEDDYDTIEPLHPDVVADLKRGVEPDWVDWEGPLDPIESAKREFGTTSDPMSAFYLLPDGEMLDGTGGSGQRSFDHRQVGSGGTKGMQEFMAEGVIRLMPESGGIDIIIQPTRAQMETLWEWISAFDGEVILDMEDGLGEYYEGGDYYLSPRKKKSIEFDKGTPPDEVLDTILSFFR